MRAVTAMGVAIGIVGFATVVTLWAAPQTAPGQQAAAGQSQTRKSTPPQAPAAPSAGQTVERHVIVRQDGPGGPAMVSVGGDGPRLGIEIHDVTKEDVAALKLPAQQGVIVASVTKDSAAEKAGLRAGDALVAYDGETVRSAAQLTRLVTETAHGRTVKIAVVREGRRVEIEATPLEPAGGMVTFRENRDRIRGDMQRQLQELDERKTQQLRDLRDQLRQYRLQQRMPAPNGDALRFRMEGPLTGENFQWFGGEGPVEMLAGPARGRLGVTVQELTPELAAYFGVKDGVLVASVAADSPAAKAGIKAGDVITTVDDKPVPSAGELVSLLSAKTGEVPIGLTRDKKPLSLKATIEAPKPPARRTLLRGTPA